MSIGKVSVWRGEPPEGNPYRHKDATAERYDCIGDERSRVLGLFFRGLPTPGYTFWWTPGTGGVRRLQSRQEVPEVKDESIDFYWDESGRSRKLR